ncbi:hypothetical protein BHE74_00052723, partial [Ensete ventricosum]
GNSFRVHRELAEDIRSLLEWCKGVHRKKIGTHRKIIECSDDAMRAHREFVKSLPKESESSLGTRREITGGRLNLAVVPSVSSGCTIAAQEFGQQVATVPPKPVVIPPVPCSQGAFGNGVIGTGFTGEVASLPRGGETSLCMGVNLYKPYTVGWRGRLTSFPLLFLFCLLAFYSLVPNFD